MNDPSRDLRPVMLSGLSFEQAIASLNAVDCAVRREHWCSPVVVLQGGKLMIDDDGIFSPYKPMPEREGRLFGCGSDRKATDWMMVPRVDDDGKEIAPDYRRAQTTVPKD